MAVSYELPETCKFTFDVTQSFTLTTAPKVSHDIIYNGYALPSYLHFTSLKLFRPYKGTI